MGRRLPTLMAACAIALSVFALGGSEHPAPARTLADSTTASPLTWGWD